jgi:hypothetical protein
MAASVSTQTPAKAAIDREAAWGTLVDRLASDLDEIAEETTARIVEGLPGYRGLPRERVFEGVPAQRLELTNVRPASRVTHLTYRPVRS